MKKTTSIFILSLLIAVFTVQQTTAQGSLLRKLKNKAEDKAVESVFGKDKEQDNANTGNSGSSGNTSHNTNSPTNTRGEGLTSEPPDVLANIGDADKSFEKKQYAATRNSVRQAILGIELEMGQNVLEELPESIDGLPYIKDEDFVASTGIGFVGLIIERVYRKDDKQFKVTVGNDAAMLSAASLYLSGGAYASTADQGYKNITIGEYRGIIEFDEYSGYKISVPIGQSSVLVTEGINFENEGEMVGATENIDIDKIKKELGE